MRIIIPDNSSVITRRTVERQARSMAKTHFCELLIEGSDRIHSVADIPSTPPPVEVESPVVSSIPEVSDASDKTSSESETPIAPEPSIERPESEENDETDPAMERPSHYIRTALKPMPKRSPTKPKSVAPAAPEPKIVPTIESPTTVIPKTPEPAPEPEPAIPSAPAPSTEIFDSPAPSYEDRHHEPSSPLPIQDNVTKSKTIAEAANLLGFEEGDYLAALFLWNILVNTIKLDNVVKLGNTVTLQWDDGGALEFVIEDNKELSNLLVLSVLGQKAVLIKDIWRKAMKWQKLIKD
jgi:hypothetical protein